MPGASATAATQILRLRNKTDQEQELWIEPLGDRVVLSPAVLYEVTATNALDEIDLSPDGFVVYGWVTKVTEIRDSGDRIVVWDAG